MATRSHAKGEGGYPAPHMTHAECLRLGTWATGHEADCRRKTYAELAQQAREDETVGFYVTESNMSTVCRALFGKKIPDTKADALAVLTERVADCERRLTRAGLWL